MMLYIPLQYRKNISGTVYLWDLNTLVIPTFRHQSIEQLSVETNDETAG